MTEQEEREHINKVKGKHRDKQSYANTRKTGKEQYYTNPNVVDLCLEEVQKHIDLEDKIILEPAGGTGEFIEGFRRIGISDAHVVSYDIEPKHELVKEGNYLEVEQFPSNNMVAITNPPFGRMSSLAVQFFIHGSKHCDYICYLIPKSWRKWTMLNRLPKNFHLVSDISLPKDCFYVPGEESKKGVLETVFQIWEKREEQRREIKIPDNKLVKKITVPKDKIVKGANFSMIVFGHSCGRCEDITTPEVEAKTTTMYFKIDRQDVKDALKEIDFSEFYNNVAYVQALSLQEINYKLNEKFGLPNFNFEE